MQQFPKCWMTRHVNQHGRPVQILEILKFLNNTYFAKIVTRKPKLGNFTKVTELYPFLE